MNEAEAKDLVELKDKCEKLKKNAIEYMLYSRRNGIANSGHKSLEACYVYILDNLAKDLDKLTKEYIKKYTD